MKLPRLTSDYSRRQRTVSLLLGAVLGVAAAFGYVWTGGGPWFTQKVDQGIYDFYVQQFHRGLGVAGGIAPEDALSEVAAQRLSEMPAGGGSRDYHVWTAGKESTERGPVLDFSGSIISRLAAEKIAIVVVDDRTLERGLQWPLPRSMYLDIVKRLEKAGARTIGLDILFGAPGPDPAADESLKEALARPSVVMPYTLQEDDGKVHAGGFYPPLFADWTDEDFERRFGFTMELVDDDKIVRRGVLEIETPDSPGTRPFYSFDAVLLGHFMGISPAEVVRQTRSTDEVALGGFSNRVIAIFGRIAYLAPDLSTRAHLVESSQESYQEGQIQVIQEGDPESDRADEPVRNLAEILTVFPLYEILETPEDQLPGLFGTREDKATGGTRPNEVIALVGVTVSGGHDLKVSPLGPISGVAIHGNILVNLLQDNFLRDFPLRDALLMIFVLALLAAVSGALLEPRAAAGALFLTLSALFYGGLYSYVHTYLTGGQLIPYTYASMISLLTFLGVTVYNVQAQKAAKEKFAKILQEVAPIPDLESLLGKDGLKVGSEERNLTILFSDIRGYTDLSESLDPVTVTEMLNSYHQAMGEVFERYGGIIFDYQGDAQMVVFGLVPASQPNHAAAACKAGAAMVLRLDKLRQEWQSQGRPVFETGVGVCTGPVAIGVLGSAQRKQYAAIGDATNTAARMQGKSKDLDSPVLITESTYEQAGDDIVADYIGAEKVKGKREPLQVYGVNIQQMQDRMGVRA